MTLLLFFDVIKNCYRCLALSLNIFICNAKNIIIERCQTILFKFQDKVKKHLNSGELQYKEPEGFTCMICDVPLGLQPMLHIEGSSHMAKVLLETISNPSRFHAVYSELPKCVLEADKEGYLQRDGLCIQCILCSASQSGIISLLAHLEGKEHKNNLLKNAGKLFSSLNISQPPNSPGRIIDHPGSPKKVVGLDDPFIKLAEQKKQIEVSERKFRMRYETSFESLNIFHNTATNYF